MNQSPEIDQISAAYVAAQSVGLLVVATNKNSQTNSKFADFADVVNVVLPVLNKQGIGVMQMIGQSRSVETMINVNGEKKPGTILMTSITTKLVHTSGQFIECAGEFPLAPPPLSGQGKEILNWSQTHGLVTTYARRYALLSALCVPTGDDDDAQKLMSSIYGSGDQGGAEPAPIRRWPDFLGGKWKTETVGEFSTPLGEMTREEIKALVNKGLYREYPAIAAILYEEADGMLELKGVSYEDAKKPGNNWPADYRDMPPAQVKDLFVWLKSLSPEDIIA